MRRKRRRENTYWLPLFTPQATGYEYDFRLAVVQCKGMWIL